MIRPKHPGYVEPLPLESEWRDGNLMVWIFQRPTRVHLLEVRGDIAGAVLLSVNVAGQEQMIQSTSLVALAQPARVAPAQLALPRENWVVGPLALPSFGPGKRFEVKLSGFRGEMRPHGQQVPP